MTALRSRPWANDAACRTTGRLGYRGLVGSSLDKLPEPRAVLFDLDGTLVDTVETRIAAWLSAFDEAGLPSTRERLAPLIGIDGQRLAREIAALAAVAIG